METLPLTSCGLSESFRLPKRSRVVHVEELLPLLDVAGRYERDLPHRSIQGLLEIKDTHCHKVLQ